MKILITGSCGFIGFHLTQKLCENKKLNVIGCDNLNTYYDIELKKNRNKILKKLNNFKFFKLDIRNKTKLFELCKKHKVKIIIHLAAQAGVRFSILNPQTYFDNNILGTFNILEVSKHFNVKHLLIASSSSVYGNTDKFPLKETYNTDFPLSFYAASKKTCEVIAHSYSSIHKTPITIMRFFTVYGTYGRPDMALFKFTKSIYENKILKLFNSGNHLRDFTYIDDVCNIIFKLINKPPKSKIPFDILNLGGGKPKKLMYFLSLIEKFTGKKAKFKKIGMQKGDVHKTMSCRKKLLKKTNYSHKVKVEKGIENFVTWYKKYYSKK